MLRFMKAPTLAAMSSFTSIPGSHSEQPTHANQPVLRADPVSLTNFADCLAACLANGWVPTSDVVLRLVQVREAARVTRVERPPLDVSLNRNRLEYVRWLVQTKRIGEN